MYLDICIDICVYVCVYIYVYTEVGRYICIYILYYHTYPYTYTHTPTTAATYPVTATLSKPNGSSSEIGVAVVGAATDTDGNTFEGAPVELAAFAVSVAFTSSFAPFSTHF